MSFEDKLPIRTKSVDFHNSLLVFLTIKFIQKIDYEKIWKFEWDVTLIYEMETPENEN